MAEIADLKVVSETLSVDKTPIFSVKVIRGEYSLPDKMEYSWKVVKMAERYLELQIDFKSPLYISTEEEPEMLEIIISDGSMFLSTDWLPLELTHSSARRLRSSTDKLFLMREIPE